MKKRSITAQRINSINSNLRSIAANFGTKSKDFEDYVNTFGKLDVYTNSDGVLQIRQTKANRKRAAKIRSVHKNRVNTTARRRQYEKKYGSSDRGYIKYRAELSNKYDGQEQYALEAECNKYGLSWDYMKYYRDYAYREDRWQMCYRMHMEEMRQMKTDADDLGAFNFDTGEFEDDEFSNEDFY